MKINPKKSLGQNFLIDNNIINKIVSIINIKGKEVLEVGPGTGNLTRKIIEKKPSKIFVIEKDEVLCNLLKDEFSSQIKIINKDILDINENEISENTLIVFGNLPYNISTEILLKWIFSIKDKIWFSELILMFQKEVADRIISKMNTSNYGRLSIISQWKFNIKKIMDIKPNCFNPKPKVESSLLYFSLKKDPIILSSKELELITRIFFNHRRKMIKNPLRQLFKNYTEISKKLNIDINQRPQNLTIETYLKITDEYEKLRN